MAKACISATGLSVAFEPNPPVFHSLDLHLPDETVALIGPNGAGKTLLAERRAGTTSCASRLSLAARSRASHAGHCG